MRKRHYVSALVLAGLTLATACSESPTAIKCLPVQRVVAPAAELQVPATMRVLFERAAADYGVPADLLAAIGYVETRWQMVAGHEEFGGQPAAFGVMALRGDRLQRGAALSNHSVSHVRTAPDANIAAAAALLRDIADQMHVDAATASADAWHTVLQRFSGITLPEGAAAYATQVLGVMQPALRLRSSVHAQLDCHTAPPPPPIAPRTDYAGAIWRASPNFNNRADGEAGVPHMLIIHTCEGGYTGCWSWLINPVSGVSAHYVVNEEGTEISQLVFEPLRAWHIGATYDCALNRNHHCTLSGVQSNHFTIGIEHAGFASQPAFPESQIDASARLACDITRDHNIPRDWQHIVAHGQLQPHNRTDPGPNWPWVKYVTRIQRFCGETVVDDVNANNDAAVAAAAAAPPTWFASDSTADYYGTGYHWAATSETATDVLSFRFYVETAGPRIIDARWTSGSNRSPRATYHIIAADGARLGSVAVDQRSVSGWQTLGTWTFPAGWHRVELSRQAPAGAVVVADAIRVR